MRVGSRVNRQQQVQVVVRLKPQSAESRYSKCVYMSEGQERQLVVQTQNKKQIFVFDHIAHQLASQQDIYRMIGQQCVLQAFEGYNCCLFAYGQTGAGKTYSVLGSLPDLTADPYAQSRGLLPRVLQQVFERATGGQQGQQFTVTCSYMEIYNEQIFDLLCSDKRIHQIREDAKRGVFVEGLIQKKVTGYRNAIGLLLEGEKTRRTASTLMNTESSRSHAIFSILVESEVSEGEVVRSRKAKLHVVDLAGSERVKHTNVEGERLREGCNINRSLHVLGNVINCLVESSKKKKHIPFRDSKLTHYLKDSLGGNSITKLLANIHTSRQYFGDTLSSLMFAKRAKSLKLKVEMNETTGENFEVLRKQIRKLRQELAQARYFKGEGRISDRTTLEGEGELERVPEQGEPELSPKSEVLGALEENQTHYKALIEIYEQHMKVCLSSSNLQRKQNINIVREWKNLQKRNISLTQLLKQLPAFTKIYKENLLLRQERMAKTEPLFPSPRLTVEDEQRHAEQKKKNHEEKANREDKNIKWQNVTEEEKVQKSVQLIKEEIVNEEAIREQVQRVVDFYEGLLGEMQDRFKQSLQSLQRSYVQIQGDCRLKQKKIKDLKQKWQLPPNIEQLRNENEYLHLSVLNLQNQIQKLQQNQQRLKVQLRQSKRSTAKKQSQPDSQQEGDQSGIYEKILQIRRQAERESAQVDIERAEAQMMIHKLQAEINKYMAENNRLREKYSKSRSKRHSQSKRLDEVQSMKGGLKSSQLQSADQKELFRSEIKYITNSASIGSGHEESNASYTKELLMLRMDLKRKHKEVVDLRKELEQYVNGDRRLQEEFGKPLEQIIEQYRGFGGRRTLQQSKSVKSIQIREEEKPGGIRNVGRMRQSFKGEEQKGKPRVNINLK